MKNCTQKIRLYKPFFAFLVVLLTFSASHAATYSWNGSKSTDWTTKQNWTPMGVPAATDDIVLGSVSATTFPIIISTSPFTCNSLTIGGAFAATFTANGNVTVAAGITVAANGTFNQGASTVTLSGNYSSAGTYSGLSTSFITFAGNNQTISGNKTGNFKNIIINQGSYLTLNSNIVADNTIVVNGTWDTNEPTCYKLSGTTSFKIGATGTVKIKSVDAPSTFQFTGGPTLVPGCTVDYAATAIPLQNIYSNFAYDNLRISGTGVKQLTGNYSSWQTAAADVGNVYVASGTLDLVSFSLSRGATGGTLTVANGAFLKIGGTNSLPTFLNYIFNPSSTVEYYGSNQTITPGTYGNLTISSAGSKTAGGVLTIGGSFTQSTADFITGPYTHFVDGSWTMTSGTLTNSASSTIELNGTTNQTISTTDDFNKLIVNKASGLMTLLTDITVSNTLAFTNGTITTGANKIIIPSGGTVTGASQSTGWVEGNLQKYVSTAAATFEVGGNLYYSPVSLNFTGLTAGSLIAGATSAAHPNIATSTINKKYLGVYWTLSKPATGAIAFTNYTFSPTWNTAYNYAPIVPAAVIPAFYNGATWSYPAISGTTTTTDITSPGNTLMGSFAVGETCPLTAGFSYPGSPYCINSTSAPVTYSGGGSAGAFTFTPAGLSINTATGLVNPSLSSGATYSVTNTVGTGACTTSITSPITINPGAGTPTAITISGGVEPACKLTNGTTTTTYASTSTSSTGLNWSLSNSAAGTIGATTGIMTWANGFAGTVNIQVTANGCSGTSPQVIKTVTVATSAGTPTAITAPAGTEPTCKITGGATKTTYSTTATNSTGFNWSVSNAAAGTISAAGVMSWTNGFSGVVDIRVTANGPCGVSPQTIRTVTISNGVPGTPTAITITPGSEPGCQLTNGTTTTAYATTATNSTGYTWSLSNSSAGTINAATGVMTWANGFAGSVNIQVIATNGCGSSAQVVKSVTVAPSVGTPTAITVSAGTQPTCPIANTTTTTTYATTAANNTGINWSLSNASAGTISAAGVMNWTNGFGGTVNIQVTANGCNGPSAQVIRSVTLPAVPSATISYAGNPYCSGPGTAPVTLTGTTGGNFSSTTGLVIDPVTGQVDLGASTASATPYTVTYTVAATTCTAQYQTTTSISIGATAVWTGTAPGATGTQWSVAGNWQCGSVPTNTSDVIIPSGAFNYPVLNSQTAVANNLTIQSGATLTVTNAVLQIAGTATTTGGKIMATAGKVEFNGTSAQTIPANLFSSNTVNDLVITNAAGVTLSGALRIKNSIGFGSVNRSIFSTNGNLTLVSTSSNTASVSDVTNGGLNTGNSIIGNVTVERYVQGKRAYRFLTAPVSSGGSIKANWMENTNNPTTGLNNNPVPNYGTHITGSGGNTNGFDASQTNNPSLFSFNNATQGWVAAPNTNGTFVPGNGVRIMVRGSRSVDLNDNTAPTSITTLRATGALAIGPVTIAATGGSPGTPVLSTTVNSYSFIANPYASTVDWEQVYNNATDISPTLYIYDPTISGSNGRGGYVAYNGQSHGKNVASSLVTNYVQSGQAFFVQTTGPNPSLTFKETYKSNAFIPIFRTADDVPHLNIDLLLPGQETTSSSADGTAVYFSDNFSNGIASDDSYKMSNQDENIAIFRDGKYLSIEGRKPVNGSDSIPLKTWQLSQKQYSLRITMANFANNVEGYLLDKFLNTTTPIPNGETLVPFKVTADAGSGAIDRFKVVFESFATLPVRLTNIKAYAKNKGIQVEWTAESESNIDLYEVEKSTNAKDFTNVGSVKAKNNPGISAVYSYFDDKPVTGDNYYRIKTIEKSGDTKESEVVRVNIAGGKNTITVANNPVTGNSVNLIFNGAEKGTYTVSLISGAGERINLGIVNYAGGSSFETVPLKGHLAKGIYQLQLVNDAGIKTLPVLIQ